MNAQTLRPLEDVLSNIQAYSFKAWLYLPKDEAWTVSCRCAVLESEEVPPELEHIPDVGMPEFAKSHNLVQTLPVEVVRGIVQNAKMQKPEISDAKLFEAFLYYYDNDAFIVMNKTA